MKREHFLRCLAFVGLAITTACGGDSDTGSGPPAPQPPPPSVSTIELTPAQVSLEVGASRKFVAVTKDAAGNALTRPVTWSSSANSIASVDGDGNVTALAAGQATIAAVSEGKSAAAAVTVVTVPVALIEVTPAQGSIPLGRAMTLAAVAKDPAGKALPRPIRWSTSAPAIATVDSTGKVTAVALGQATITAAAEGKTAEVLITVVPVPVASVQVAPDSVLLKLADSTALTATVRDDQGSVLAGRSVRWRSSNVSVATVDSITGRITAVDAGAAMVSAVSEAKVGAARIVVYAPVATVTIAPGLDTLEAYDTVHVAAVLRDAKQRVLTGRTVRWTSSNPAVATIDSVSGQLAGIDRGTVTVTATSETRIGSATRVVVIKYRSITAGTMHACDIASGGIAWCWGLNGNEGRIGATSLGTHANSAVPVAVRGGHQFTQLATYARTTCGITRSAQTFCWGYNGWGALGSGSSAGLSVDPVRVSGGQAFVKLAVGLDFACGLNVVGALYCWGYNGWGQFGNGATGNSAVPVAAAPGLAFSTIAAGSAHMCGVAASGTYCWGADGQGQLGDGGVMTNTNTFSKAPRTVVGSAALQSLALGDGFSCGRTTAGQGYCWGAGNDGRLGSNSTTNTSAPRAIAGGLLFESLTAGYSHACGVATGQALYCWGTNRSGQLGAGSISGSASPQRVPGFLALEVAAAGIGTGNGAHTCAISADRLTVRCWGLNDEGQLGNGTVTPGGGANVTPSIVVGQRPL